MSQRNWIKFMGVVALALATYVAHATDANVAGDAYVNSATPAINYGGLSNLYVASGQTALLQFDLSSLPAGTTAAQIGKASLKLYVNRINTSGSVNVLPVTSAWSEPTVTYNTIPTFGSAISSFTPTTAQQFVIIDVTSLVQNWVTTPSVNYGIALTSTAGNIVFDSKENDETSHVAHLDITVVSQGPTGMAATVAVGTVTTGATGTSASVSNSGSSSAAVLNFTIPTGATGAKGDKGDTGTAGATGPAGPQGQPVSFKNAWNIGTSYSIGDAVSENGSSYIALKANTGVDPATDVAGTGTNWAVLAAIGNTGSAATIAVGTVTTGAPGSSATVTNAGSSGAATFNFTIPQGATGATGPAGPTGPKGDTGNTGLTGPQGPPVNFIGAWVSNQQYQVGDAVSDTNGSSYIAKNAVQSVTDPSSDSTNWSLLAAAGTPGAPGAGFSNGSAGGQIYITGSASPFAPALQPVTGDVAITSGGVTTINAGAVTNGKIANNSVSGGTSVAASQIQAGSVTGWNIAGTTITASNIATGTITGTQIHANTISGGSGGHLEANTVTASNLDTSGTASASTYLNGDFKWQQVSASDLSATGISGTTFLRGDNTWATPSGGSSGFTWTSAGPNTTDTGPDIYSPVNLSNNVGPSASYGNQAGYAFAPVACTVKSLFVAGINVPDPGYTGADKITVTVQHNGTNTSMSCAVSIATGQTSTTTTCSDTTDTFSVAAGDTISYSISQTNATPYEQIGTTLVCE